MSQLTFKEIEKNMAFMRKDVLRWSDEFHTPEVDEHKENFAETFKAARLVLTTPLKDWPNPDRKYTKLWTLYVELTNIHEALYELVISYRTKTTPEIKKEFLLSLANDFKQPQKENVDTPEIKEEQQQPQIKKSGRGGPRPGSGRPSVGPKPVVRKVSITLPQEEWDKIDANLGGTKLAEYFRDLVLRS